MSPHPDPHVYIQGVNTSRYTSTLHSDTGVTHLSSRRGCASPKLQHFRAAGWERATRLRARTGSRSPGRSQTWQLLDYLQGAKVLRVAAEEAAAVGRVFPRGLHGPSRRRRRPLIPPLDTTRHRSPAAVGKSRRARSTEASVLTSSRLASSRRLRERAEVVDARERLLLVGTKSRRQRGLLTRRLHVPELPQR